MHTWLVTGTPRGIGLELARQIVAGGDIVFVTARSPSAAPALPKLAADSPPGHVHIIQLDVEDTGSVQAAIRSVDDILQHQGLDYPVNNAARVPAGNEIPLNMNPAAFLDTMNTNVHAPEGPVAVNTSSFHGSIMLNQHDPNFAGYAIPKAGLNMLTYKQSEEKPNIIFFAMHPGWVKIDMGGENADLEISFTVEHQYKQITAATRKDKGTFKRLVPWVVHEGYKVRHGKSEMIIPVRSREVWVRATPSWQKSRS